MLLADDDPMNRQLTSRLLESRGWSVAVVDDGEAALAALTAERFDLVLLDVEMPRLDGPEVARHARAREAAAGAHRTPLVALTAHRADAERRRCLAAGMDDCLSKPLVPAELERLLAGGTASAPAEPSAATAGGVDWEHALAAAGGDRELLGRLTASARGEVERRLAELAEALETTRDAEARRAAHSLRGALRIFGAGEPRALAAEIERLSADGRLAAAGERLPELRQRLAPVLEQLDAGPPTGGEAEED